MTQIAFGHEARRLRVGTLVRLRWYAAAGQIAAIVVSRLYLQVTFPVEPALLCVCALIAFNGYLWWTLPPATRANERLTSLILGFDIIQLWAVLSLTGGLSNPFSVLLLAPTMISAVSQAWWQTVKLLALAIVCDCALALWRIPLKFEDGRLFNPPPIETAGFLIALVVTAVFVSLYGGQVSREARQLAEALAATELILTRAQHLSQLDGLAAAAAHQLGTPLATLTVIVHELSASREVAALCGEDLALARQELARCRVILGQLSNANRVADSPLDRMELDSLLEEVAGPHRLQDIDIHVAADGKEPRPTCARNPALLYGLRNLVENAISFARSEVHVEATWTRDRVEIAISDDGPGFPQAVLMGLGEPYISYRTASRRAGAEAGLGLGLFIAKALLERTGAELTIGNLPPPERGARAGVAWPRQLFEGKSAPPIAVDKTLLRSTP
jgi:two-component system sensor histidine kinase RegB